jgi:hypothetical protein
VILENQPHAEQWNKVVSASISSSGASIGDTETWVVHLQIDAREPTQRIQPSNRIGLGANWPTVVGRPTPHGVICVDVADLRQAGFGVADFELERVAHGQVAVGLCEQVDQTGCSAAFANDLGWTVSTMFWTINC